MPKFLWLHSIGCPQCRSPLALNDRGRTAFTISFLVTFLLGALIAVVSGDELIFAATVILGLIVASLAGSHYGRLYVPGNQKEEKPNHH